MAVLRTVHIRNFGLVEDSRLEFEPGLNVLTGESGAGKSLVVEAIDAALGARVGPERLAAREVGAQIQLTFEVGPDHPVWAPLSEWGVEPDEVLTVRRELRPDGRSLYRLQAGAVPAAAVRQAADFLIELSGQHQHQRLLRRAAVTAWFDRVAGLTELAGPVREAFAAWRQAQAAWEELKRQATSADQAEAWRRDLSDLQAARLAVGEEARLAEEVTRLRAASRIAAGVAEAYRLLEGDGTVAGAAAALARAMEAVSAAARYDRSLVGEQELLASALAALEDVRRGLARRQETYQEEPLRLPALEERLDQLARLQRRFGRDIAGLVALADELRQRLAALDQLEWERARLGRRLQATEAAYRELAERLAEARRAAADPVGARLTDWVRQTGLEHAALRLTVEANESGPQGTESIAIEFCANAGSTLYPVERVASGGEMARITLAMTVMDASQDGVPLVFDEVDSGLSGESARKVAALLARLGEQRQVLVVSHQPVVAARAAHHWVMQKAMRDNRTVSWAEKVEGAARVAELARMLSGRPDALALAHAEALLRQG